MHVVKRMIRVLSARLTNPGSDLLDLARRAFRGKVLVFRKAYDEARRKCRIIAIYDPKRSKISLQCSTFLPTLHKNDQSS